MGIGCRRFVTATPPERRLVIRTANGRPPPAGSRPDERVARGAARWTVDAANFRIRELGDGRTHLAEIDPKAGWGDLLRTWFSLVLLERRGILLHAAAVVRNGRALVFSGPSGSGKTTLARLAGAQPILSDESVALRPAPGSVEANATPFFGEMVGGADTAAAPVGEIFLIDPVRPVGHHPGFRLAPVPPSEAAAALLSQTFLRPLTRASVEAVLSVLEELVGTVRVRRLTFQPTPEIWNFLDARSG